jgi:hypothetical protein
MSEIILIDGEAFIRASETFTKAVQLLPPSRADHDETMMILQCLKDNSKCGRKSLKRGIEYY